MAADIALNKSSLLINNFFNRRRHSDRFGKVQREEVLFWWTVAIHTDCRNGKTG